MVLFSLKKIDFQTGTVGGGGAREIEAVSAHSDADTVYFRLGGLNGGNHSGVGYFAVMGNGIFGNKEDGVGAGGHAGADALGKAS